MDAAGVRRWAPELTFGAIAAVAFVFYVFVYGRQLQVGSDDLRLLSEYRGGFVDEALHPFVVHWATVPYLIERVLFGIFGFASITPWVAVGTASWVAGAALVRVLSVQAGVGPWTATVAASVVLACAAIYPQVQPHSFQVPLAVALGLAAVAGANRGRLGWSMLFGLLAIMTASVGVAFVAAAAAMIWIRRSVKQALVLAVVLGGLYLLWYLTYGQVDAPGSDVLTGAYSPAAAVRWFVVGVWAAMSALGHWWWNAALILLCTIAGTLLAWTRGIPAPRRDLAVSLAVAGAGILHLALTYALRSWAGTSAVQDSRYLYVTVLTLSPMVAVAMAALAARWRAAAVLPALLVMGALGNLTDLPDVQRSAAGSTTAQAQQMVQLATSPAADQVPGWVIPHASLFFRDGLGLTDVDFLRSARDSGRLPGGLPVWEAYDRQIPVRLGFADRYEPVPAGAVCRDRIAPLVVNGPVGTRLGLQAGGLSGYATVQVALVGDPLSQVGFASWEPSQFEVILPGPYVVSSSESGQPFRVCRW